MYQLYYFLANTTIDYAHYFFVLFLVLLNEARQILAIMHETTRIINGIEYDDEDETQLIETDIVVVKEKYEDKFLQKYNHLTNQQPTVDDSICRRFVMETTPMGNVIMHYDTNKELFVYYSDNTIPYRYLETVARKYVCIFNCKELYVARQETIVKPTNVSSVKTKDLMNQKMNPKQNKPENTIIEVKMNRFSNAGRFSNFNILQPVAKHLTDKKRLLKFSDFKKLNKV